MSIWRQPPQPTQPGPKVIESVDVPIGGRIDATKTITSIASIWTQPLRPQQLGRRITAVTAKTSSDAGSGADAKLALLATLIKVHSGFGIEHILDRALVLSESGSGLDVILALLGKKTSDAGTCSLENSYLHIIEGVKESHETGIGGDASSLRVLFGLHETGTGLEAVIARALFTRELPTGASDLAKLITATLAGHEVGTGAEGSVMSYYQKVTETGSGSELSALSYLLKLSDSGIGAEAVTLLAVMIAHDTGMGVERVIARLLKLAESGMGAEVTQLVGLAGRAMKARMYTRPYFQTRLYTRPYYKTRLYISETKT